MSSDIEFTYEILSKMSKVDSTEVSELQMVEYKKSSSTVDDDSFNEFKKKLSSSEKRKKKFVHRNCPQEVWFF